MASDRANTYELDEEKNDSTGESRRKIRIAFSDAALDSASPLLSTLLGINSVRNQSSSVASRRIFNSAGSSGNPKVLDVGDQTELDLRLPQENILPLSVHSASEGNLLCFEVGEDGELFTTIDDFKGKRQSEQQRRFILIYILDYQSYHNMAPTDDNITAAAIRLGFYEKANFKKYLRQIKEENFVPSGAILKPRDKTQSYLDIISQELADDSINGIQMTNPKRMSKKRSSSLPFGDPERDYAKAITDKYPMISQINSREFSHSQLSAIALHLLAKYEGTPEINSRTLHAIIGATRGYNSEFRRYSDGIRRSTNKFLHLKSNGLISLMPEGEAEAEKILSEKGFNL